MLYSLDSQATLNQPLPSTLLCSAVLFMQHKAEWNSGCAMRLCLYVFCSDSTKYHRDACSMVHLIETKGSIHETRGSFVSLFVVGCCLFVCSL